MTNIEDAMANLSPEVRKRLKMGDTLKAERQELPSLTLTKELGGGFAYGRIATVHGSKAAGKSSLMLQTVALAQQQDKLCAWVDAEKAYDSAWAERMGVDTAKLAVTRASDMWRAGDEMAELIAAGFDFIVVDSISALIQPSYLEKDSDQLAGMEKTTKIGDFSKGLKALIRTVNYANDNTLIVFISQQTTHIAQTYTKNIPEGGKAIEYYSSQVVRLNSTPSMMIKTSVEVGNKSINKVVGRDVDFRVDHNKLGPEYGTGSYQFYFLGDEVGVDQKRELIQLGLEQGVIEKGGSWYTYNGEKWQGEQNFIDELRDNEVLRKELRNDLSI